jgi:hypothetical protein
MPRTSCCPPAPFSPVAGSNTPILSVSPAAAALVLGVLADEPQAHSARTMHSASISARNFFILFSSCFSQKM